MYLSSLTISNFRKFQSRNNIVSFVSGINCKEKEINIAQNTTLIVGKNNAGKTTVIKALEKITEKEKFTYSDFNLPYLSDWLEKYLQTNKYNRHTIKPPFIEFEAVIGLNKVKDDYINNLAAFTPIKILEQENANVSIIIRFEVSEEAIFHDILQKLDIKNEDKAIWYFLKFIDSNINLWTINYYSSDERSIPFKLGKLIELVSISAIHITKEKSLTDEFNKILLYKIKQDKLSNDTDIDQTLDKLNNDLDIQLCNKETQTINNICEEIMRNDISVHLSSNLTKDKIINSSMLLYQYEEGENLIPENQFGLGYSNIVMIIAQVIEYIDQYSSKEASNKINIICIEEPETHMHPQMQEFFIRNIDKAINRILSSDENPIINSQLILTTHSPHILNSKILDGNSFNDIDFISEEKNATKVVNIHDNELTIGNAEEKKVYKKFNIKESFSFIRKHITLGMTEMFFADAIILVEGDSEEKLIPFFIQHYPEYEQLKGQYISVINIGGAFAGKYKPILEAIDIPVAIITDLDIKKDDTEKQNKTAIKSLNNRTTTNSTLHDMLNLPKDEIDGNGTSWILDETKLKNNKTNNIGTFFGTQTNGIYPSSLEEALYLANCQEKNNLLIGVLSSLHPNLSKTYPLTDTDNSARWQYIINEEKGLYSTVLLKNLLENEKDITQKFIIPEYIINALNFIIEKLSPASRKDKFAK